MTTTTPKTRQCTDCKEEKPLEEFWKTPKGKYGRRSKCRVCLIVRGCNWLRKNTRRQRSLVLQRRYGITLEDYEQMLKAQEGVCKICLERESALSSKGDVRRLCVDHDHQTGRVRGLLCVRCNAAIARFEELGPHSLDRVYGYLWGKAQ